MLEDLNDTTKYPVFHRHIYKMGQVGISNGENRILERFGACTISNIFFRVALLISAMYLEY